MYRSYFSSSFDRKNIHKLSCEICLKISCTLIDWYFLQEEKPWQKIDVSVPANAEHESLQRLLSHQRISINTPYTCITNNTFWFPISNNHLMFNIHNASFRYNKNWISPDDTRFAICFWFYCWSARGIPCLQQKMQWLILFLLLSHKCVLWVS